MLVKALPRSGHLIVLFSLFACSCLIFAQQPDSQSAQPKSHRMPVARRFSYACDGGFTLNVTLREQNARITFKEKSYSMKQVHSGSGIRYSDGKVVWSNKGYEGFLQDETNASHPVKLADNCKQTLPAPKSP